MGINPLVHPQIQSQVSLSTSTMYLISLLVTYWLIPASLAALPSPLICEDPIDGSHFGYDSDSIPCFVDCTGMEIHQTGYDTPYTINSTEIPYCMLNCVRKGATPSQSARAPECSKTCAKRGHYYNPEVMGWCMFWCVDGYKDVVASRTCVPEIGYATKAEVFDGETITARGKSLDEPDILTGCLFCADMVVAVFTKPAAWKNWYRTETVLSHNDLGGVGMEGVRTERSAKGMIATSATEQAKMSTTISTAQNAVPAMTSSSSTSTESTVSEMRQHLFSTVTSGPPGSLWGVHEKTSPPSPTTANGGTALYPSVRALVCFAYMLVAL